MFQDCKRTCQAGREHGMSRALASRSQQGSPIHDRQHGCSRADGHRYRQTDGSTTRQPDRRWATLRTKEVHAQRRWPRPLFFSKLSSEASAHLRAAGQAKPSPAEQPPAGPATPRKLLETRWVRTKGTNAQIRGRYPHTRRGQQAPVARVSIRGWRLWGPCCSCTKSGVLPRGG